ncbi:MAG: SDR family NAD(P)-dependent oxidoreductase, partial [Pseudomonadota bacterium]
MPDFKGQIVLITGGNMGLGAGVARAFVAAGATVIIAGLEEDTPEVAAAWAAEFGADVSGMTCDITDPDAVA